jgi:mono/diheme cytochrome c family protein
MYICATDSFWGAQGGDPDYPVEPGALYSGSIVARVSAPRRGVFAALDVTTNRLVWRQQWTDTCYSGSITTAGGLVFVGRNDGRITALDTRDGKRLWEFQTDGGVNAPASTFERNGKQYVVVYAGGTSLAGSKRSDGVWLFSLDGKIQSLPRGSAEPPNRATNAPPVRVPANRTADIAHGRELYAQTCVACHGSDGTGGVHGAPLRSTKLSLEEIVSTVAAGRNEMPAFGRAYEPEDLHDVAAYIVEKLRER